MLQLRCKDDGFRKVLGVILEVAIFILQSKKIIKSSLITLNFGFLNTKIFRPRETMFSKVAIISVSGFHGETFFFLGTSNECFGIDTNEAIHIKREFTHIHQWSKVKIYLFQLSNHKRECFLSVITSACSQSPISVQAKLMN